MKLKTLMLSLFSVLLLAACAETPENVISKSKEKQNNHTAQSYDNKPQSISVQDLKEDIDIALSAEYSNFDLSSGINIKLPESFTECDFIQVDGFSDRADEIAGRFFDSEILKSIEIKGYSDKLGDNYTNTSRGFRDESKILASSFIYGAFSTLPAFFLSSFCKNPYIITCLPFMLIYVWYTAINKLTIKAFELGDMEIYEKIAPFQPNSSAQIIHIKFSEMTVADQKTLIFNGVYLTAVLAGFIVIMNLRTDQGN